MDNPEGLGPPLELEDADWGLDKDSPTDKTEGAPSGKLESQPVWPEFLDHRFRFRHRRRTNLVIDTVPTSDGRQVVMVSARRYAEYQDRISEARSLGNLFHGHAEDAVANLGDELMIHTEDDVQRLAPMIEGQHLYWEEESPERGVTELSFIVRNLPKEDRQTLDRAIAEGRKVTTSILWGPKWKVSRFEDGRVCNFEYPVPQDEEVKLAQEESKKFLGSNFVVFSKVRLIRRKDESLHLGEALLAEANVGTTAGGRPKITADLGNGPEQVQVDRTLPGLIQRHEAGDPLLTEREFLYNQFPDLVDDVSKDDKRWVRPRFLEWVESQLDTSHKVRRTRQFKFRVNERGEIVTSDDSFDRKVEYSHPVRINVREDGYLCNILEHIVERSHALRRLNKYRNFEANYPVFREALDEGGEQAVAKSIVRTEAMVRRLFRKNRDGVLHDLAYLMYFFAQDKQLDSKAFPSGINLVHSLVEALKIENNRLHKIESPRAQDISDADWSKLLAKVREMLSPRYFQLRRRARWVEKLSVHGPRKLYYPRMGNNHRVKHPDSQFRRSLKPAPHKKVARRSKLVSGFDVYPPEKSMDELRDELASLFVDYVNQLDKEGQMPNTYALFRDREERTIRGQLVCGNYFYNRARALWRDQDTQLELSSQDAVKELFHNAQRQLGALSLSPEDTERLRRLLDYELISEQSKETKHISGQIGEVYVALALHSDIAALLNIRRENLPQDISCQIAFADVDRKLGSNIHLVKLNEELDQEKTLIPDFIINLQDRATGEVAPMLVEVKTHLKPITVMSAKAIIKKYSKALEAGWPLIVVSNSPRSTVRQEAVKILRDRGVIMLYAEDVARALNKADRKKYQVPPNENGKKLGDVYAKFGLHPGAFISKKVGDKFIHREYAKIYKQILRDENDPDLLFPKSFKLYYQKVLE